MGRVPGWLLRHRITIEPFTGVWDQFDPPVSGVRCAIQEKIITSTGQAGVLRVASLTIVTQLGVRCPAGSRVTLADGRRGYAAAVVDHDSAGLPAVPDHQEIAVAVAGPAYGAPLGGELVVILRRVKAGEDRYGNQKYTTTEVPIAGAAVRPLNSDESGGKLGQAVEVILPSGTAVAPLDRLRVRGLVYEVDGQPEDQADPMTGGRPGVRVVARRVT
jgi:hypothetical protein